jgi:hypothetical protein
MQALADDPKTAQSLYPIRGSIRSLDSEVRAFAMTTPQWVLGNAADLMRLEKRLLTTDGTYKILQGNWVVCFLGTNTLRCGLCFGG